MYSCMAEGYRHELKYRISYSDYLALKQRISMVMDVDGHTRSDGRYIVRSIYFDNINDKALREKLDGVQKREKFRIRYYNDDLSFLMLEKKIKVNSLCMKIDARVTEEECRRLFEGDTAWMLEHPSGLVRELYCKMKGQILRPKTLVSYIREPYVYHVGNVRITFDYGIRGTLFHREFLEEEVADISVEDTPGEVILEVKYDAFLPEFIQVMLQSGGMRQQAYSKYGASRRFG